MSDVQLRIDSDPQINLAMQQNEVPVIKRVRIVSDVDEALLNLVLRIECPGAAPYERRIACIESRGSLLLDDIRLDLDAEMLSGQLERDRRTIRATIAHGDHILSEARADIDVLAHNEWGGVRALPEIAAAFSIPNHPSIASILQRAREVCLASGWSDAFAGYREGDPRQRVHAIWEAISDLAIGYVTPPASFEHHGQKVRLPDQIVDHRQATCLDLVFLFAAVFEQAGMAPLLLVRPGHAWAGVWLQDDAFPTSMIDDAAALRKRVDLGEMLTLETTLVTSGGSFEDAVSRGRDQLDEEFELGVDLRAARRVGIRPLPIRATESQSLFDGESDPATVMVEPKLSVQPSPVLEDEVPTAVGRLDSWKRRLLDLSLRNRLINHRQTRSTIPLLSHDIGTLEDALASGRHLKIVARPGLFEDDPRDVDSVEERTGESYFATQLADDLARDRLRADLTDQELERRLTEIYRAARSSREESGSNTLFLAIGFLEWYETPTSSQARLAPILLLPLEMVRKSVREGYSIRLADEEPSINVTLLEKLRSEFGVDVRAFATLPEDDHGIDVASVLDEMRRCVRDIERWDVRVDAQIGLFSFTKFVMWADLEQRTDALRRNDVVSGLIEPGTWDDDEGDSDDALCCPLDADSSQLEAIMAASNGRSFVLEGPPGTGKSQTISNLIAHLLQQGKRVLFVAEKMAALDVVRRRLETVGLGPYCLELHSNRSSKKQIVEEIGRTLMDRPDAIQIDWSALRDRLRDGEALLDTYVATLHEERPIGSSFRDALANVTDVEAPIEVPDSLAATLDSSTLDRLVEAGRTLEDAAIACGDPATHPLRLLRLTDWTTSSGELVVSHAKELATRIDAVEDAAESMCVHVLGGSRSAATLSASELQWMHRIGALLTERSTPDPALLTDPDWEGLRALLIEFCDVGRRRDQARQDLRTRWADAFFDASGASSLRSLQDAERSWFLARFFKVRSIRRSFASLRHDGVSPTALDLSHDLDVLAEVQSDTDILRRHPATARLGTMAVDGEGEWDDIESLATWCESLRDALEATPSSFGLLVRGQLLQHATHPDIQSAAHLSMQAFCAAWNAWSIATTMATREIGLCLDSIDGGFAPVIRESVARWHEGDLRSWAHFNRTASVLEEHLPSVVESVRATGMKDIPRAILESMLDAWVRRTIDGEDTLRQFSSTEHERVGSRYADDDRHALEVAAQHASSVLASRLPTSSDDVEDASEVGILMRQMRLSRRHMPLRSLFGEIPNLLARLKPCFLMSPLSVAQYLDPEHPAFDVVVFDEASQIPVWDAIGAIGRGRQVIVVGDSKQLPPTTFFQKQDDEFEDEAEFQEVESVLDECVACGMPRHRLRWHYRSRHESLITFSNHHYYDDALETFPSPIHAPERLGVSLRRVEGTYDRGATRTNRAEAEAIVAEILSRVTETSSIGVVTFSIPQQHLIEDLLDEARQASPDLDAAMTADEPLFVKNLENVQGDERDIILFSICYGPDTNGKLSMGFGPLNRAGGERRLNVAITRARRQVIVFASVGPEQIDLARTQAIGVAHLKSFLEYAGEGPTSLGARRAATNVTPDELAVDLQRRLRARDIESDVSIGCSSFRVDLGICSDSGYALGVLFDGANYARASTARDRDRLRSDVLKALGWSLHRVWAIDYWNDPEKETDRIVQSISGQPPVELDHEEVEILTDEIVVPGAIPYLPIDPEPRLGEPDAIHEDARSLKSIILATARREAPVHLDVLRRRVAERFGIGRITARTATRIDDAIGECTQIAVRDDFVHRRRPFRSARYETENARTERNVDQVAIEEIANAAALALEAQISMPREHLVRAAARVLGYSRVTDRMRVRLDKGVQELLESGRGVESEGVIRLT